MKLNVDTKSISKFFGDMLDRTNLVTGWLNRVGYPMLLKAQQMRWQTEGASEGVNWAPLTSRNYKTYKLKRFADYPGGGRKTLIATGRLAYSMTLSSNLESNKSKDGDHYKLVQGNKLEMGTFVPYAKYQQQADRDMVTIGPDTEQALVDNLRDYIVKGTLKVTR